MGYRCFLCGDADKLSVNIITSAKLTQDEDDNFQTEVVGDHEWDDLSTMWCECGASAEAGAFNEDNPEVPDGTA